MLPRRIAVVFASLAVATLVAVPARATVMLLMSVEELARTSDAIVLGRVIRTEPRRETVGIVTHVTLAVDDWWAGADRDGTRSAQVELCVHGGRIGNHASHIDGQAVFTQGEDVVVFLFKGGDALWPQGMSQGKWLVRNDVATGAARADSQSDPGSLVQRDAHGALVPVPFALARPTMPLAALHARVLAARSQ